MPENPQHSPQVSALLGRPPGWLIRWGIAVVFAVIVIVVATAAYVRYPEVVRASATLTGTHPPQVLLAQVSGRFSHFFVPDGHRVQKGTTIAVMATEASYFDVTQLDSLLALYSSGPSANDTFKETIKWPDLQLGEMNTAYHQWQTAHLELATFYGLSMYKNQREALKEQLLNYKFYYQRSWQQRMALQQRYNLALKRYRTDSVLTEEGVYSQQDLSRRKEELLQLRYNLHAARAALAQTKVEMADLEKNLQQLNLDRKNELKQKELAWQEAYSRLRTALKKWRNTYTFTAKVAGTLHYQTVWAQNQNIAAGNQAFTIVPPQQNRVKVRVLIPAGNAGKVEKSQAVHIKLAAYPFEEYGVLKGTIARMNTTPIEDSEGNWFYIAEVKVPNNLQSSYGKPMDALKELSGEAEIITADLSALERILYFLRRII